MRLFGTERPWSMASACAPVPSLGIKAHTHAVGIPAVLGTLSTLAQHETVQVQRIQARRSWNLTDIRRNGSAAKAIGMGLTSKYWAKASGVPPRGKPV